MLFFNTQKMLKNVYCSEKTHLINSSIAKSSYFSHKCRNLAGVIALSETLSFKVSGIIQLKNFSIKSEELILRIFARQGF